ncbi:trypsin-like peptidase domain-containing protein [Streptosporangium soli]|nr:trypsin-like peptidase domain-containing protein [Streptosporangium sp. KLBMP 9127]
MTDETRTRDAWEGEGRTPSDFQEPTPEPERQRPDFLPADEVPPFREDEGRTAHMTQAGSDGGWGDPSGRTRHEVSGWGDPPGGPTGDTAAYPNIAPMTGPTPPPPPPPPSRAFGMGPGWAPPPPGPPGGQGGMAPGKPVRRGGPGLGVLVALAVVIALVAAGAGSVGTYLLTRDSSQGTDPSFSLGTAPTGSLERAPDSIAGVASKVLPSVVSLEVEGGGEGGTGGSGFLIKGGYIVTNNHVVAPAAKGGEIRIAFNNRKTTMGRIVGRDPSSDLAVVKPDEVFGMPEIALGDSASVVVGDPVIAIGSPLGLSGTVTTGIVSSLNRPVIAGGESGGLTDTSYINAIQTDAAINPGNSGGPLVNTSGQVIGVNSAIATVGRSAAAQGGSIGLGFSIPVNHARRVAEDLVSTGSAKTSRIGISIDPGYQGQGVRIASDPERGVAPVESGGPADKAGLKPGDVITELNGTPVQNSQELMVQIRSMAPGDKLSVKFQRGGQEKSTTVVIAAGAVPTPQPS